MTKTFAYIDVIGVKKTLADKNKSKELLERFWTTMDTFTNNRQDSPYCKAVDTGNLVVPDVYCSVFSDSALIDVEPDIEINDFYKKILKSLKICLDKAELPFYCIVSSGDYIGQAISPKLGGWNMGSGHGARPLWNPIAGSGDAWIQIFEADTAIKKHKAWHEKYSLYALGNESLLDGLSQEEIKIGADANQIKLHACSWPV